jgi:hypothetical protein
MLSTFCSIFMSCGGTNNGEDATCDKVCKKLILECGDDMSMDFCVEDCQRDLERHPEEVQIGLDCVMKKPCDKIRKECFESEEKKI